MTPHGNGRHCSHCAKTVIDFTKMTNEQIQQVFTQKSSGSICGRFKSMQLQQVRIELPQNIFNIDLPVWKRFLVASLLVFSVTLFSCDAGTTAEAVTTSVTAVANRTSVITGDTIIIEQGSNSIPLKKHILGKPAKCVTKKLTEKKGKVVITPAKATKVNNHILMGEPAVIPVTDTAVNEQIAPEIMGKMIAVPVNKGNGY